MLRGNFTHNVDNGKIGREIIALKTRVLPPPVILRQFIKTSERASQETATKRRVRDKANAERPASWQNLILNIPLPQRILALQRRNRRNSSRAAQRFWASLGQADMLDFPFGDQLRHRADGLFNRHIGIDAVLII